MAALSALALGVLKVGGTAVKTAATSSQFLFNAGKLVVPFTVGAVGLTGAVGGGAALATEASKGFPSAKKAIKKELTFDFFGNDKKETKSVFPEDDKEKKETDKKLKNKDDEIKRLEKELKQTLDEVKKLEKEFKETDKAMDEAEKWFDKLDKMDNDPETIDEIIENVENAVDAFQRVRKVFN